MSGIMLNLIASGLFIAVLGIIINKAVNIIN